MKSLIIGIARTGKPNNYVLNDDTKYISMCGSKPEISFSITCGQDQFIKEVNGLRYDDADPSSSAEAISFFENLATKIFDDLKYLTIEENDPAPLHIRLVTTPLELAQIPFEFALAPPNISGDQKIPLFAHPERKITLTREIRQESEARYGWPDKPRVLFAWAAPNSSAGMTVPHDEHRSALEDIVKQLAKPDPAKPYPEPDIDLFLTELPNASIESIKEKLDDGIDKGRPYTHVNILAHGGEDNKFGVANFRLILCKDGTTDKAKKVDGETLAKAIVPADPTKTPTVVSLSACDSGNVGNTILPAGSLVYQLHNAGVPCVFASQFPLTQPGSVQLIKTLYRELINGCDPRLSLYETRMVLRNEPGHDWASLVAYARFPQDINEQLQAAKLKTLFNSMKVANAWVDHVFKFWEKIAVEKKETLLQELESRLNKSIHELSGLLKKENDKESALANELLRAEHLGLLGSAYKRKAEYFYRLIEFNPEKKDVLAEQSRKSLETAKGFYNCGLEANPASHWTTMQYLSLKAVTEGALGDESELWYVTKRMAQRDEKNAGSEKEKIWAWGTLTELYLLKPLLAPSNVVEEEIVSATAVAIGYMKQLAAKGSVFNDEKESTARQFERYINWWADLFEATYPKMIRKMAMEIRAVLPSLDALL